MPFKSETTFDKIYLKSNDGSLVPIMGITDIELTTEELQPDKVITATAKSMKDFVFSVDCAAEEIRKISKLLLPNNWRKMHHIPMMRKTASERRR